jgi:5-methylcytosine-specific restriction protein B
VTDLKEDVTAVAALVGLAEKKEVASLSTLVPADDDLVRQVYLPREWLQEVIELLTEKRHLIFYGPPGTGKTFLAQRLAEHLTRQGGALEIVQFHPSYGYEDFFEGYRPAQTTDGVGVTYELTPGPLRRIAEAATQDLQHPYVLVIDEINRGNLPKIFGELLFLLEYREAQIPLQYSPETPFGLPKNLFVIGTMNTADRSIALVDAALRRRFYFVPFMPTEAPVRDVLASWLKDKGLEDRPARLLAALNERIANEEIAIGPSYFMSSDSKAPDLARIWKHAILPVLEEHFYGVDRDVETEFGLEALEKALNPQVEAANLEFDQADESV